MISPLITHDMLRDHILHFLDQNPTGVRNTDVGRAIGYNDTRQWFSYGLLEKLIKDGLVEKHGQRYFKA
tara:strand:- start:356 stop:562 length:207 start_codon:yes stop_codon:yes gene_type:complete